MSLLLKFSLLLRLRITKLIVFHSLRYFTISNQRLNCQSCMKRDILGPRSVVAENVGLFEINTLWSESGR